MMKQALAILLSLLAVNAEAQVVIPYTFSPGDSVSSSKANANWSAVASEINSHEVATNPHQTTLEDILTLSNSCGAQAINFNESQALAMRVENLGADPTPGHKGRVFVNTVDNLLKYDDGTNIISIAGTGVNTLSSVLNSGNSAGAFNLDMNGNQILSARLENRTSAPSPTAGRIYYRTDLTTAYVCSGASCTAIGGAQSLSSVLGVGNSAGSTNIDFNSNQAKNMVMDTLSSDPGSPTAGQLWYNSTSHIPKFYNGTSSLAVGNTNTLAQTLSLGNSAGSTAIDFNGQQGQHMVVWNNAGSPGTGTGGYLWYDTGTSSLNYETSGSNRRVCSLDGTETLTNKTIDGGSNTLTNIADSSLSSNVVLKSGSQTITGTKTFSGAPVMTYIKTPSGTTTGHQVPDGISDDTFVLANATQTLAGKTLTAPAFTSNTNFNEGQAVNFRVENRTSNPTAGNPGRVFYKSTTGELLYDDGTNIHALTASGLSVLTGNQLTITGTSDVTELSVQGNATQTANIVEFLKSDSSLLFGLSNAGNVSIAGNLTTNSLGSGSTNPATAGAVRLASSDTIDWRNNANSGNIALGKDTSDQLSWAGTSFLGSTGVLLAAGEPAHTGDVTNSAGSLTTAVSKIAGTTVSGTTGTGNVVFSASPTVTGTVAGAASTWTGTNQAAVFQTGTATPATAGILRLASADAIDWRNNGNSANVALAKDTSDQLTYNGTAFLSSTPRLLAGAFPALSGDITTSAGSLTTTYSGTVPTNKGGTNLDTSASTGVAKVSSGTWSVAAASGSDFSTQTANRIFVGPSSGAVATPTFRAAVPLDVTFASQNKTASYSLQSTDRTVKFSGLVADVTATLPDATTTSGLQFYIKNLDATHKVTINTTSAQTLDGRASGDIVLAAGYNDFIQVFSDGSNWQILGKKETQFITGSGSHVTGSAPNSIYISGSATASLTSGTWRVSCTAACSMSNAGTTNFGSCSVAAFAADGANSASAPTSLSGVQLGNVGSGTTTIPTNGTAAAVIEVITPPFLYAVTSSTPVFCVPNTFAAAGTQSVSSSMIAERVW